MSVQHRISVFDVSVSSIISIRPVVPSKIFVVGVVVYFL